MSLITAQLQRILELQIEILKAKVAEMEYRRKAAIAIHNLIDLAHKRIDTLDKFVHVLTERSLEFGEYFTELGFGDRKRGSKP